MELKCDFMWLPNVSKGSFYTCCISKASITQPGTEISAIIGNHLEEKSNNDVTAINICNTTVHFFPRGLYKIFRNLKALWICKCGLKEISREDLMGLEGLEQLIVNINELQSLPSDLLIGMDNLKSISFNQNKLEFMSSKLFEPIAGKELVYADFRKNRKFDVVFGPGGVESLQQLIQAINSNCNIPTECITFKDDVSAKIYNSFLSGKYSDYTITVSDDKDRILERCFVHKILLAAQSAVFAAAFDRNSSQMDIADFNPNTVEGMLHFMYKGEVKDDDVMSLFAIAAKYKVTRLQEITKERILHKVNQTNAIEIFSLGHLHNSLGMKFFAFNEIKKMISDTELDDSLMDKPELLNKLLDAHRNRKRKRKEAQAAEKEFEIVMKQCRK